MQNVATFEQQRAEDHEHNAGGGESMNAAGSIPSCIGAP